MVVGVSCQYLGGVSFDDCVACARCLPSPFIRSLKQYDHVPDPGKYGIRELIGCMRQAHYKRIIGIRDEYKSLNSLWMMKRGSYLGNIAQGTGYNELEGIHKVNVGGEEVQIRGKLDCYDYQTKTIIEIKSTRITDYFKPREMDVLQLQCYVTLYRTVFSGIEGLKLVYLDMNRFKTFDVDMADQTDFLEERVKELHRSIVDGFLPEKESSQYCKYCVYRQECDGEIIPSIEKEIEVIGE